ncbi:MAG TPA: DUF6152 family protein [Steroidobacteraceae bacterium]|nr:DUF6152 family protein [Steroidobacteraceae bacterium]
MRLTALVMMAAVLTSWAGVPAYAHHSTGLFDSHLIVEISGTVAEFRWLNPHAAIVIVGTTKDGAQGKWTVEMMAPTAMMDAGWTHDTLAIGDRITVFAHPLRDPAAANPQRLLYAGVILPDHRRLGDSDWLR